MHCNELDIFLFHAGFEEGTFDAAQKLRTNFLSTPAAPPAHFSLRVIYFRESPLLSIHMLPLLTPSLLALIQGPWSSPNLDPAHRAEKLMKAMTLEEKFTMLHGPAKGNPAQCTHPAKAECAYVGNVAANDRLGIPPLTMNDGPQGFRNPDGKLQGTSTAWPSGLTMAASWDPAAVEQWGKGMGKEFRAKGSNVQLGPGLCLARVVSALAARESFKPLPSKLFKTCVHARWTSLCLSALCLPPSVCITAAQRP